ncbi:hypothetical protein ATL10_101615 [Bacillus sp. 196mf]|nr:hypothetical protein ATL10_101615 [Bacillus sp. 196mf]SFL88879.1 hypothetical protein SAMN04488573_105106 [Bacillus sp. 5mfcol3.1]
MEKNFKFKMKVMLVVSILFGVVAAYSLIKTVINLLGN